MMSNGTMRIVRGGRLLDAASHTSVPADILVDGDTILEIGAPGMAAPEAATVIDASDRLLMPGLINAHTHAHGALAKGMVGDRWPLEVFLNSVGPLNAGKTVEDKYLSGLLTAAEMVRKGCTASYDLFVEFPLPTVEGVHAVAQAYQDVGMRAVIAPMMADRTLYRALPGLIDAIPEPQRRRIARIEAAPFEESLAACRGILDGWRFDRQRIRPALAPTIPLHCSDAFLVGCRDLAREYDVGLHTHLAESKTQAVLGLEKYEKSLTAHLDGLGLLGPNFTAAHAIWVDQDDISRLADQGASVAHNVLSNLRLGSGVASARRMIERGPALRAPRLDAHLGQPGRHGREVRLRERLRRDCPDVTQVAPLRVADRALAADPRCHVRLDHAVHRALGQFAQALAAFADQNAYAHAAPASTEAEPLRLRTGKSASASIEPAFESSPRMRRNQRHHSVATEPKPVHPIGQPIRASTNGGLSVRPVFEVSTPALRISRSGRKGRQTACSFSGRLLRDNVFSLALSDFQSRAAGVAQSLAWCGRSAFRRLPALGFTPSHALGVAHARTSSVRLQPLDRWPEHALGVGHILVAWSRPRCAFLPLGRTKWLPLAVRISGGLPPPPTFGMGQDEQALAPMRRADFSRREQSFRNPEAQVFQLASDLAISEVEMIGDVFEEHPFRCALGDDPGDVRPQVPGIASAPAPAGDAERLARIARREDVHRPTPWVAVEGGNIVPDRRRIQGLVFHPRHEDGRGEGVPLDITHSSIPGLGQHEAKVEPSGAGAERKAEQTFRAAGVNASCGT